MSACTPDLILPEYYELIAGDTFELFFKGILNVIDVSYYDFEFTFENNKNLGNCFRRKYCFTPTEADIGDHRVTICVRDNLGNIAVQGSTILRVSSQPESPETEKIFLCVGDSLTAGGQWPAELYRRLTENGTDPLCLGLDNIRFIGDKLFNNVPYVGFGGWKYDTYNNAGLLEQFQYIYGSFSKTDNDQHALYKDENENIWKLETISPERIKLIRQSCTGKLPSNGKLTHMSGGHNTDEIIYSHTEQAEGNPFWNSLTQSVDLTDFASRHGVDNIDYCCILLGWNSSFSAESDFKSEVRAFLNSILSAFPHCKITLVGLQVPSRDGFGNSYGVEWKYYDRLQFVWNLEKWYKDICKEADFKEKVKYIQLSGQFDTEYNMPVMQTKPNLRSEEEILIQSNGVHPKETGYLQIADAVFRHIASNI